jgi:hypothetical protein
MTGSELRRIRNSLDLSRVEFGRALGYRGENVSRMVRRLEDGERKITEEIAEIATGNGGSEFGAATRAAGVGSGAVKGAA